MVDGVPCMPPVGAPWMGGMCDVEFYIAYSVHVSCWQFRSQCKESGCTACYFVVTPGPKPGDFSLQVCIRFGTYVRSHRFL